jgi:UDP-2,4-diacetamido-2,4,6-trideoxy-beta-L-altropyranose hydrolase
MKLILRKATADDSRDVWLWRNDEETRRNSRTTDFISWERHDVWYQAMLKNRDSQILVALDAGVSHGMIRFDQVETNLFRANIAMAPLVQGRGLGRAILRLGCDWLMREHPDATILAEVRIENLASQRIFEANSFHRDPARQKSEFHVYVRAPGDCR